MKRIPTYKFHVDHIYISYGGSYLPWRHNLLTSIVLVELENIMKIPQFRIRRIGGLSGVQLGLGIFLGVASGYYVWKPIFQSEEFKNYLEEKTDKKE